MFRSRLQEKFKEALQAVLPIMGIVLLLSFTVAPVPSGILLGFLTGGFLAVTGMMLFSMGAELAMQPMGEYLGSRVTRTKKLQIVLPVAFSLGFMITISEPDLQVLARQVPSIPTPVLIGTVGAGVGLFLIAAMLRMFFSVPIRTILLACYGILFVLAVFVPSEFVAVAFDSGGVTTGPMTVPFIMSFGLGIAAIRSDRHAETDSFGLIALCSVGPVLAVMALSMVYRPDGADYAVTVIRNVEHSVELSGMFASAFPEYLKEIAAALVPIAAFFFLFLLIFRNLSLKKLSRIVSGLFYTFAGLVIFMLGVNTGFMPAGVYFGEKLGALPNSGFVIPIGMLMGYFIVKAEPAVYILMKQVEELTDGNISGKALQRSLSAAIALAVGLAMIRVLTGVSILWFLVPGYAVALILSFFVPKIFTAIAFDSGGVASGPMTATFLLPFAIGVCISSGGDIVTDAFGVVAMVAMMPLITIQILGVVSIRKERSREETVALSDALAGLDDDSIIEF